MREPSVVLAYEAGPQDLDAANRIFRGQNRRRQDLISGLLEVVLGSSCYVIRQTMLGLRLTESTILDSAMLHGEKNEEAKTKRSRWLCRKKRSIDRSLTWTRSLTIPTMASLSQTTMATCCWLTLGSGSIRPRKKSTIC